MKVPECLMGLWGLLLAWMSARCECHRSVSARVSLAHRLCRTVAASPLAALLGSAFRSSFPFPSVFSIPDALAELLNMEARLEIIPCSNGRAASSPALLEEVRLPWCSCFARQCFCHCFFPPFCHLSALQSTPPEPVDGSQESVCSTRLLQNRQ